MNKTKSFCISKKCVWDAYKRVRANKGSAGCDGQSIQDFEKDLKNNLYKIWNRMSSGSYFAPPVLRVEIPKGDGSTRPLGIPTVSDRIAQMVVKLQLEPELERCFHTDSYGYRPNKSAAQAVGKARQMCWRYDWVVDLDIKGFFDNIDHELLMRAVRKHAKHEWIILYVERWLKAPVQLPDGTICERTQGTPQGGVVSPLLANLFLHYAFDKWLEKNFPHNPFERYADDSIVHCHSEREAKMLKEAIANRLKECKLELHPKKTKVVYCKDANRREDALIVSFDFLGFTFRPRTSRNRSGKLFVNFSPAISQKAKTRIASVIKGWNLHMRSGLSIQQIADNINPMVRGWISYYGRFHKSALHPILHILNWRLFRWAYRKYKRFKRSFRRVIIWMKHVSCTHPKLFTHWSLLNG